jgi:hypothetical protein
MSEHQNEEVGEVTQPNPYDDDFDGVQDDEDA